MGGICFGKFDVGIHLSCGIRAQGKVGGILLMRVINCGAYLVSDISGCNF